MQDAFLIGLTGRAGAGKDTCADILAHYGFAAIAFASPLRLEVSEAFGVPLSAFIQRTAKETPFYSLAVKQCRNAAFRRRMGDLGHNDAEPRSPRWVMQRWGTEYRREQSERYWTDALVQRVHELQQAGKRRVVVTDVRFDNEAACVRQPGGHVLQVHRPELRTLQPDSASHISEPLTPLASFDVIHNDGDLDHLHAELVRVLNQIGSLT